MRQKAAVNLTNLFLCGLLLILWSGVPQKNLLAVNGAIPTLDGTKTQEEYEDQGIVQGENASTLGISHDQLIKVIEKELKSHSIQPDFETDPDSNSDNRKVVEKTTGLFIHSAGPKQDLLNVAIVVLYDQFMSQTVEGRQSQEHFMALNKAVGKAIAPNAEVDFMSQINKLAARGVAEIQLGKEYQAKIMLQRNAKGKKVIVFVVSGAPNSR